MIGGIVLSGGQSRRMGRSKAWLPFGEEVLLQRIVRILGEVASPLVVVAAAGQDLPGLPDRVAIVRDPVAGLGPLQGFVAGLETLSADLELAYLTSTDAPFLKPEWVGRLVERIGDADVALPQADGFAHPLSAVYRIKPVLEAGRALLSNGRRSLMGITDLVKTLRLEASELAEIDPDFQTIRNLNTLEEYERALLDWASDCHMGPG